MPITPKRDGTLGFSSMFSFATVARPSYSDASASTVGPRRRHGPHHSAHRSTSTTPCLIASSKLLSVNVFTLSDAILPPYRSPIGPAGHHARQHQRAMARSYTLTYSRADASHE